MKSIAALLFVSVLSTFATRTALSQDEWDSTDTPREIHFILPSNVQDVAAVNAVMTANRMQREVRNIGPAGEEPCLNRAGGTPEVGAYGSILFGSGHGSQGGNMHGRAMEIRIGEPVGPHTRIDYMYNGEGHPFNNHRDGFAAQAVAELPITDKMRAELGAGPYYSMNTTTRRGREYNDKDLGVLASAAFLYYLDGIEPGLHVRLQYSHVQMPGGHPVTEAIMLGIGRDFGGPTSSADGSSASGSAGDQNTQVTVLGVNGKTTHGIASAVTGAAIEIKRNEGEHLAYSATALNEGRNDGLVNRGGLATQVWYVAPVDDNWTLSAGAGPYLAEDKKGNARLEPMGIFSLQTERKIGDEKDGLSVILRFSRVASSNSNDKDLTQIGFSKKF